MNPTVAPYDDKSEAYFSNVRREILPLLPASVGRVFEVGCGNGSTLSYLKASGRCAWAGGIELFPPAAASVAANVDLMLNGNIEAVDLPIELESLDAVLCLDVLEHLIDPWLVVRRLVSLLKPGGMLVCSIPNVRNFRVLGPLLFQGRWRYAEWGILDRTHLRFFTRESALELVESSGLSVDRVASTGLGLSTKAGLANFLTLTLLRPFFEHQYLIRGIKANASSPST